MRLACRSAKWAKKAGVHWMERIYRRHREATTVTLATTTRTLAFQGRNHIKPITSECHLLQSHWMSFVLLTQLAIQFRFIFNLFDFQFCHNSGANNNWNGFENDYDQSASKSYTREETTTTSSSIRKQNKTEAKGDFGALDVKASKPKPNKNKASVEDDAWDLLNNWKRMTYLNCQSFPTLMTVLLIF